MVYRRPQQSSSIAGCFGRAAGETVIPPWWHLTASADCSGDLKQSTAHACRQWRCVRPRYGGFAQALGDLSPLTYFGRCIVVHDEDQHFDRQFDEFFWAMRYRRIEGEGVAHTKRVGVLAMPIDHFPFEHIN